MSLENFLDARADEQSLAAKIAERDAAFRAWANLDTPIEVRLNRFDTWVTRELEIRVNWAWAGEAKAKRIGQCRIELETLILALWRRGWMLDGRRLAKHVQTALDDVAAAQKAGRVREFWPFFQSVMKRYVGINAEEIQNEAMSAGANVAAMFETLVKKTPAGPSLPELIAQRRDETIREKQSRQRRAEAVKSAEAGQLGLF